MLRIKISVGSTGHGKAEKIKLANFEAWLEKLKQWLDVRGCSTTIHVRMPAFLKIMCACGGMLFNLCLGDCILLLFKTSLPDSILSCMHYAQVGSPRAPCL